jgi:hypothetical protein
LRPKDSDLAAIVFGSSNLFCFGALSFGQIPAFLSELEKRDHRISDIVASARTDIQFGNPIFNHSCADRADINMERRCQSAQMAPKRLDVADTKPVALLCGE